MIKWKQLLRTVTTGMLAASLLMNGLFAKLPGTVQASAAQADSAVLTVDLSPEESTGEIMHGAAGFLYGVSSENVPTTNTIVPLKSKILVTKGAVGTEHPYGDALDVAKTFLESGGRQIQMYNSNYYGVFGVTASIAQYSADLKNYIAPAVVAWKEAWKKEHGTPQEPKDPIGAQTDIDKAIVYVPINEGTPVGNNDLHNAWKSYRDAILSVDTHATLAGPNDAVYRGESYYKNYIQFCADRNCLPDVVTWHELQTSCLQTMSAHMKNFRQIWNQKIDWSAYNEANHTTGVPTFPQICINEYAEMEYCGVPGRLVNWIARLEDEKITGCLPFWHQANNLNDLAAGANEGNGAWWLYKWYGDMSGETQPVMTSTAFDQLYGVSTMDDKKKISTTLLGGFSGDITVELKNVTQAETFRNASAVHVQIQETMFTGFHGAADETPVILDGIYAVDGNGNVTVRIPDALFENAYHLTLTQAGENENVNAPLQKDSGQVYEAEEAELGGKAKATAAATNPSYYMSNKNGGNQNRAVNMQDGSSLTYHIEAPVDGKYRFDFAYGNGQGTVRNNMKTHDPVNLKQEFSLDDGMPETITMESTLFQTMTGIKTLYYDLTAGSHTVTIETPAGYGAGNELLLHDFVRVSYAGVYEEELPLFHKVYEAELSDVNRLLGNLESTVSTRTELTGYTGDGYVTGLSERSVKEGGGIRTTVVVPKSGLYNVSLRYHSGQAGQANLYVENTAVTLDRLNKTVALIPQDGWQTAVASVYLQKGINVVDVDTTVNAALDHMRVQEIPDKEHSTVIEAEDAVPQELADSVKIAQSEGASGGKYVEGMAGSYRTPDYLEFSYQAASAGKYQMQVYHSNEDLAGSHSYNIKATDKYAVVEVNGKSDSPRFTLAGGVKQEPVLYYFADCGDHDPETVSEGDSLGAYNSVTDRYYGTDEKKGYKWGLVCERDDEVETPGVGSLVSDEKDKAVYTNYQKALSNSSADLEDGKKKEETFRYAHNQGENGIDPRYISYRFELDPEEYQISVCMGNTWNNAGNPKVTFSADGMEPVEETYAVNGNVVKTKKLDLTDARTNEAGRVELSIRATSSDPTIQMNYIKIEGIQETESTYKYLVPDGEKVLADPLPQDIYMGELAEGMDWFIDFRNLKNKTDRYFFINTFSDDTFREKTITLDLKEGKNTIRIYNDNSWNTTYGGSQNTPATTALYNETPNFDKFVITPMALAEAEKVPVRHAIDIGTTKGGIVTADHNEVGENGAYALTLDPEEGYAVEGIWINGTDRKKELATKSGQQVLLVSGVCDDQNIKVYFAKPGIGKDVLQKRYDRYRKLEKENYSVISWEQFLSAFNYAGNVLSNQNASQYQITDAYEGLEAAVKGLEDISNLLYFVDCGDHDPATVTYGDSFGRYNSVTDQIYGTDQKAGYQWGLVLEEADEKETPGEGSRVSAQNDRAVYTNYQKALSNSEADLEDGQNKKNTFRYAHNQSESGIDPRYISYRFELEPDVYRVTVGMSNTWNNAGAPKITLAADGVKPVVQNYAVNGNAEKTMEIDLKEAVKNKNGKVELSVKATSQDPTIQMCYILVKDTKEPAFDPDSETEPGGVTDPDDIRPGNLPEAPAGQTEGSIRAITLQCVSGKIAANRKVKIAATVETTGKVSNTGLLWTSSDSRYATVDANGVVTTKKAGIGKTVVITAKAVSDPAKSASVRIKIMKHAVKKIRLTCSRTVKAGKKITVKAQIKTTGNKVNKKLLFITSNSDYATVNAKGVVTAKKAGKGKTVKITAISTDGTKKKASVRIKIK
ncbi:MAG: hypothetical protein E7294_11520 [Lachnospiraceae bacterium]|jgi:hypothetical protein|nr:hypothetical protein [Lachnospiraceae bacterium]